MKHLFSHSVYRDYENAPEPDCIPGSIQEAGADGLELLTGYFDVDTEYRDITAGVHLPYSTDWYSAWTGVHDTSWMTDDEIKFIHYGKDRDGIVSNIVRSIRYAAVTDPAYGVLHAGSVHIDDLFRKGHRNSDTDVLNAFAEMVNSAVSHFNGGEPPFRILFENLWWPGLKMLDDREFRLFEERLEFDNWGFCLDTGHMMNALGDCYEETSSINSLLTIFEKYPREMKDRIMTMHLQLSTSAEYTNSVYPEVDMSLPPKERLSKAYGHVCRIDQHRQFTSEKCIDLVNAISPDFVTHEIVPPLWDDRLSCFRAQRSFFV